MEKGRDAASNPLETEALLDETIDRVRQLNESIMASLRGVGLTTLTSYEALLQNLALYEIQLNSASQVDFLTTVVDAHAQFIRDSTTTWARAASGLLS
jgi:predicted secreted protein